MSDCILAKGVGTGGLPSGAIIIWSGAATAIPTGWVLCNGSNSTPDLRDRFVIGAGTTYSVGATGGAATHTLTVDQMPSHTHSSITSKRLSVSVEGSAGAQSYSTSGETGSSGGGKAHNNLPPYYALCYIMKT